MTARRTCQIDGDMLAFPSPHPFRNKLARWLWQAVWLVLYRPSPRSLHGWRRFLLRLFGAKIAGEAHPYPAVKIWAPWNLEMGHLSCLADGVDCYCVDRVILEPHARVSQYSFLCTATHDYSDLSMPLVTKPIRIREQAWVCADVFVGPGVSIGAGAVVAARSVVHRDVPSWTVVAGNPARFIKPRNLNSAPPRKEGQAA